MSPLPYQPRSAVFYSTARSWGWGAPDYVWPRAAAKLAAQNIPVVAVVRPAIIDHPEIRALAEAGVQIHRQPPLIYRRGKISAIKDFLLRASRKDRALRQTLRRLPAPHYFIEQGGSYEFLDERVLLESIASRQATYDVVFRSNQPSPPMPAEQRKRAIDFLASAHRTVFNSSWTREITELQLLHRFSNAAYIQHLVRFPHEHPLPWPVDDTLRLASVSRLDCHHKGLDALLQALARLPADAPRWSLDLYGYGSDEHYLRGLVTWLGLQGRVHFHTATNDIQGIWRRSHLLVLVSRYEGLAVSMLEAMACGRPVLRTPYGGFAEWNSPGETGFLCPAAEPVLIAESLLQAFSERDRWPQIGQAAHARIRSALTPTPEDIFLEPFGLASTSRPTSGPLT